MWTKASELIWYIRGAAFVKSGYFKILFFPSSQYCPRGHLKIVNQNNETRVQGGSDLGASSTRAGFHGKLVYEHAKARSSKPSPVPVVWSLSKLPPYHTPRGLVSMVTRHPKQKPPCTSPVKQWGGLKQCHYYLIVGCQRFYWKTQSVPKFSEKWIKTNSTVSDLEDAATTLRSAHSVRDSATFKKNC